MPAVKHYEEKKIIIFCILTSLKKGVGSGSGSISQRFVSGAGPKCHGSPTLLAGTVFFFINKLVTVPGPAGSGGDAGEEDRRHPALGGGVEAHHPHGGTERPLRPHLQRQPQESG